MKHFRVLLSTLLASSFFFVPAWAANSAGSIGKVRYILGEVTVQKKAKSNWNPLRVGLKVRENDVIRTLVESEAGIALSDGSLITIEENTTIQFETAVKNQSKTVNIQSGRVFFDVQKQKEGSQFQFKTGTATAAIRGTNGFVESGSDGIIVSLESGKMIVTDAKGKELEVNGGETLVQDQSKGLQKFKTPSSGSKKLAKEISAEKKSHSLKVENLEKRARELDEKNAKAADSLAKAKPCEFEALPQKISATEIKVNGKCAANVQVSINSLEVPLTNGKLSAPVSWEKDSYGTKRIRVKCKRGEAETLCLEAFIEYVKPTTNDDSAFIRIQKSSPISMNGTSGLTIQGEFFSEDPNATITVKVGKSESENLNSKNANGRFSVTFAPNDPNLNWDEKSAIVTLKSAKKVLTDSVAIQFPPKIRITGSDANQCTFQFSLTGTNGKKIRVEESVDGIPTSKAVFEADVPQASFPMLPGRHVYKIFAKDENDSQSEATETFTCKQ